MFLEMLRLKNFRCFQQAQKEDKNASRGSVKNLELIKKNRETQLKALTDDTKKDNVLILRRVFGRNQRRV